MDMVVTLLSVQALLAFLMSADRPRARAKLRVQLYEGTLATSRCSSTDHSPRQNNAKPPINAISSCVCVSSCPPSRWCMVMLHILHWPPMFRTGEKDSQEHQGRDGENGHRRLCQMECICSHLVKCPAPAGYSRLTQGRDEICDEERGCHYNQNM